DLGGQTDKSKSDIKSLIQNPNHYKVLVFTEQVKEDGTKTFKVDFTLEGTGITQAMVDQDAGLKLLQNIVLSDKNYLYESTTNAKFLEPATGMTKTESSSTWVDKVYSRTPEEVDKVLKSETSSSNVKDILEKNKAPKDGYDGQVAINPGMVKMD